MHPSQHVDGDRLWQRLMDLARFGARPDGGVDRQTLTADEIAARAALVQWGRALGLQPFTDPAANLFLRLSGREPELPAVLTGSHIDTQPTGGKFDGAYGVLAGLEAVQAILASGERPRRSIEVVAWTNEEGCRFSPGMTGSELYAGTKTLAELAGRLDPDGVTLGDALAGVLAADRDIPMRPFGRAVAALIEAHIEQGPLMERDGLPVGVVTSIQGTRRYRVTVSGAAAHAGTAERADRRDALLASVRMVSAMERATATPEDVKFTVGLFQVSPNVPSVVPESVVFSIDVRHPEDAIVDRIDAAIARIVAEAAAPCTAVIRQIQHNPTVTFSPAIRAALADAADALGIPHRGLSSAAGHDARSLNGFCPTGMLFVPCRDGVSHHPAEWSDPADLLEGARVLTDALWNLASIAGQTCPIG